MSRNYPRESDQAYFNHVLRKLAAYPRVHTLVLISPRIDGVTKFSNVTPSRSTMHNISKVQRQKDTLELVTRVFRRSVRESM